MDLSLGVSWFVVEKKVKGYEKFLDGDAGLIITPSKFAYQPTTKYLTINPDFMMIKTIRIRWFEESQKANMDERYELIKSNSIRVSM